MYKIIILLIILLNSFLSYSHDKEKRMIDSLYLRYKDNSKEELGLKNINEINYILSTIKQDSVKFFLTYTKTNIYTRTGDYRLAYKNLLTSKNYINTTSNLNDKLIYHTFMCDILLNLGINKVIDKHLLQIDSLVKYNSNNKSIQHFEDIKNVVNILFLINQNKFNDSKKYLNLFKVSFESNKNKSDKSFYYMLYNLLSAKNNIGLSNFKLAEEFITKNEKYKHLYRKQYAYESKNIYASIYLNNNEIDRALDSLHDYNKEDLRFIKIHTLLDKYKLLSRIYSFKNKQDSANFYLKKVDSIEFNIKNNEKFVVELLLEDIKIDADEHSSKKNKYLLIVISVLLLVTLFIVLNFYRTRKKLKFIIKKLDEKSFSSIKINDLSFKMYEKENDTTTDYTYKIEDTPANNQNSISSQKEREILEGLIDFELSHSFLNNNMSLSTLSSLLNTNQSYITEIIKKHKKLNFSNYLHSLRINYLLKKLEEDEKFRTYKIAYLSEILGYSSYETFTRIFKSIVGVSPSVYINSLK